MSRKGGRSRCGCRHRSRGWCGRGYGCGSGRRRRGCQGRLSSLVLLEVSVRVRSCRVVRRAIRVVLIWHPMSFLVIQKATQLTLRSHGVLRRGSGLLLQSRVNRYFCTESRTFAVNAQGYDQRDTFRCVRVPHCAVVVYAGCVVAGVDTGVVAAAVVGCVWTGVPTGEGTLPFVPS